MDTKENTPFVMGFLSFSLDKGIVRPSASHPFNFLVSELSFIVYYVSACFYILGIGFMRCTFVKTES